MTDAVRESDVSPHAFHSWHDIALHAPLSVSYQLFTLGLCLFALSALAFHSFARIDESTKQILEITDNVICVFFFVDFVVHVVRAKRRMHYLLTWGWIDLLSSIPAVSFLRWGRAARVVRVVRVLRGARATKLLAEAILERRGHSLLLAALLISMLLVVFSSIGILQLESVPEANIKSASDALWWAIVTITTVGYGDRYPVTGEGRILAAVLMVFGVALFGTISGFIASWFVGGANEQRESEVALLRRDLQAFREELAMLRNS
jgi:voltage-gated potassium channel